MSTRDRHPSYISTCARVGGDVGEERERAPSLQRAGQGPAYQCVYILHYAAWERKSIELSAVNAFSPAAVPTPGCSRRMLQIKQQGKARGAGGQETDTLTGRSKAQAQLRGRGN